MTDAVERLVNLAMFLEQARTPVSAERVRAEVFGYPQAQSYDSFIRMFERDKDQLRKMGLVIDADESGGYTLCRSATFATAIELTSEEAAAVKVAATALLDDPSFPFREELRLALAKMSAIGATVAPPASARLADEEPERQGTAVAALSEAARTRKSVRFAYTNSRGESRPHDVEPYGLFLHDGRWYLVGRDSSLDEQRTYTVARIRDLHVNASAPKSPDFERPAAFDVATFVRLPFQYGPEAAAFEAELRFAPSLAWRAAALTGGSGELAVHDDGSLSWRVRSRSRSRLLRFVIENGPGLSVAGPDALVDALHASLRTVVTVNG